MTEWAFVPKNDDTIVAPPWLKFSPADGILAPGERMTITATIFLSVELLGTCFPTYTSGPLVRSVFWLLCDDMIVSCDMFFGVTVATG